jgi:hypothetical protein
MYFIRKSELLQLVYNLSDSEVIMEVMDGAPPSWATIIGPHHCRHLVEFSAAIKYHELYLENQPFPSSAGPSDRCICQLEDMIKTERKERLQGISIVPHTRLRDVSLDPDLLFPLHLSPEMTLSFLREILQRRKEPDLAITVEVLNIGTMTVVMLVLVQERLSVIPAYWHYDH